VSIKGFSELYEEWKILKEQQMKPQLFRTTTNVTRETFNYVVNNPGCVASDIVKHISSKGMNPSSASAILTACIKQNMIKREDGHYYALQKEYTPLKYQSKNTKPKVKKEPPVVKTAPRLSAEYIVEHIGIAEAKVLYRELKEIFENV